MQSAGSLAGTTTEEEQPAQTYDFRFGETDLLEGSLRRLGQRYLSGVAAFLLTVMGIGLIISFSPSLLPNSGESGANPMTLPTLRPTSNLPTVTVGPPTATPSITPTPQPTTTSTPTPEPCIITVRVNDTLIGIISACGHTTFGDPLLDAVQSTNSLRDLQDIRPGDVLSIPWPTPTVDPNLSPTEPGASSSSASDSDIEAVAERNPLDEDFDPFFVPTATLQPGIAFHTVQPGEDIISIAVQYGANLEILSQINPEITFAQCDFGEDFGGERCSVFLAANQLVRVPAPTALPTLSPTPSGSETSTATPTATFNAPVLISPDDRSLFRSDELVTLRWVGSGALTSGDQYRLRIENISEGVVYSADSTENSFVLPVEWQGVADRRYEFSWSVSVVTASNPDELQYTTQVRSFIWEGSGQ